MTTSILPNHVWDDFINQSMQGGSDNAWARTFLKSAEGENLTPEAALDLRARCLWILRDYEDSRLAVRTLTPGSRMKQQSWELSYSLRVWYEAEVKRITEHLLQLMSIDEKHRVLASIDTNLSLDYLVRRVKLIGPQTLFDSTILIDGAKVIADLNHTAGLGFDSCLTVVNFFEISLGSALRDLRRWASLFEVRPLDRTPTWLQ